MPQITALNNYAAILSVNDVLAIVDLTNNETKKITMTNILGLITDVVTTWRWQISGTSLRLVNPATLLTINTLGKVFSSSLDFQTIGMSKVGSLMTDNNYAYFTSTGNVYIESAVATSSLLVLRCGTGIVADTVINDNSTSNVGIGLVGPTARLHLPASAAAANKASLKINPGVFAAAPVSGNIESDGIDLTWTDAAGRRQSLNRLDGFTVITLPVAPVVGDVVYVTDALLPAFHAVVAGGGAVVTPVFYDGANWIVI